MSTHDILRYPIGPYKMELPLSPERIAGYISDIERFPARLRAAVLGLSDAQLDTPYRPGGWTVRQVVNHCSDSHLNALARFKLAVTEENPTIRPYFEDRWAELADSKTMPIGPALALLDGLHARWTVLLRSFTEVEMVRTYVHPEYGKVFTVGDGIGQYAWHCNHHLAHITSLKAARGWE